jgi:hypothetical protein
MEILRKVDQIEEYMKKNLGSDWTQIKNFWAMDKKEEMYIHYLNPYNHSI